MQYSDILEELPEQLRLPVHKLLERLREELLNSVKRSDFERLETAVTELTEEVRNLAQAQARTEAGLKELAQAHTKLEARVDKLTETVEALIQAQARTEATLNELAEAQKNLAATVDQLAARVDQLAERLNQLAERFDQLAERFHQLTARIDQLTERVDQLTERLNQLAERFDQLTARIDQLTERVDQLTERVDQLTERLNQLAERFDQLTARVDQLAQAQARTEATLQELIRGQLRVETEIISLKREQKEIRRELGGVSHTIGFTLENQAYPRLPAVLKKDFGVEIPRLYPRFLVYPDGRQDQINIYGEGTKGAKTVYALGEAKAQLGKRDIDSFLQLVRRAVKVLPAPAVSFMVTYLAEPAVEEYARQKGLKVYWFHALPEPGSTRIRRSHPGR